MTIPPERRALFLKEMGLGPSWRQRQDAAPAPAEAVLSRQEQPLGEDLVGAPAQFPAQNSDEGAHHEQLPPPLVSRQERAVEIAAMDWPRLQESVAGCIACDLCRSRTHTVFGTGDRKAKWLFVGEGPGYNEDRQGEPFVGVSGRLLDNMMTAMGLARGQDTFIANIVKCRPTDAKGNDRPPTNEEAGACRPYLERQIALLQPSVIVALGKTAAFSLLGFDAEDPKASLSALRSKSHQYRAADGTSIPVIVTYHPAYLLRRPAEKAKAWTDLCLAMEQNAQPL